MPQPVRIHDPEFGDRVRRVRTARGWSQRELSERSGIAKRSIEDYEAGYLPRTAMPKLAKALGVTEFWLAHGYDTLDERVEQLGERLERIEQLMAQAMELRARESAAALRIWTRVDAVLRHIASRVLDDDALRELPPSTPQDDDDDGISSIQRSTPRKRSRAASS